MMNFEGKPNDVMTLAHELGHGIHQYLARQQGALQSDTPLTTAETASVFGEMLIFQDMMAQETDPEVRLAMLLASIAVVESGPEKLKEIKSPFGPYEYRALDKGFELKSKLLYEGQPVTLTVGKRQ